MKQSTEKNKFGRSGRVIITVVIAALVLVWGAAQVRAQQSPDEALDKINKLLGKAKEFVTTLTDSEAGEKELLKYLSANISTNAKIQRTANDFANKKNSESVIEKITPIFSGYLGTTTIPDLVKVIRQKLEMDGYRYVEEETSWGETQVRLFKEGPTEPRNKSYLLRIDTGWITRIMDSIQGQGSAGNFFLLRVEKS